jgi:hypothetical protein
MLLFDLIHCTTIRLEQWITIDVRKDIVLCIRASMREERSKFRRTGWSPVEGRGIGRETLNL